MRRELLMPCVLRQTLLKDYRDAEFVLKAVAWRHFGGFSKEILYRVFSPVWGLEAIQCSFPPQAELTDTGQQCPSLRRRFLHKDGRHHLLSGVGERCQPSSMTNPFMTHMHRNKKDIPFF
jgi:hypothetical protein